MRKLRIALISLFLLATGMFPVGCGGEEAAPAPTPTPKLIEESPGVSFQVASTAFGDLEPIPAKYTCDGEDISPPLEWSDVPQGCQGFALIVDDLDAPSGSWVHWILYRLPAEKRSLSEGIASGAELPDVGSQGRNSWGRMGYDGPCPPSGTHRYMFKIYALDTVLELGAGASKEQLSQAMQGHILAETELIGLYHRQ